MSIRSNGRYDPSSCGFEIGNNGAHSKQSRCSGKRAVAVIAEIGLCEKHLRLVLEIQESAKRGGRSPVLHMEKVA